jgi:hypothetical protein
MQPPLPSARAEGQYKAVSSSGLNPTALPSATLQCPHAAQLPALRWKLSNLGTFRKRRPEDFAAQADALDTGLGKA